MGEGEAIWSHRALEPEVAEVAEAVEAGHRLQPQEVVRGEAGVAEAEVEGEAEAEAEAEARAEKVAQEMPWELGVGSVHA